MSDSDSYLAQLYLLYSHIVAKGGHPHVRHYFATEVNFLRRICLTTQQDPKLITLCVKMSDFEDYNSEDDADYVPSGV